MHDALRRFTFEELFAARQQAQEHGRPAAVGGGNGHAPGADAVPAAVVDDTRDWTSGRRLVASTCLGLREAAHRRFDYVIVDEAGQLTEAVALAPLLLGGGTLRDASTDNDATAHAGSTSAGRGAGGGGGGGFVLVGDHYQLPPLVVSNDARKGGMDVSLFKRLAETHPDAMLWLDEQYRMNDDIMSLANHLVCVRMGRRNAHS